jgi:hypothetical protein
MQCFAWAFYFTAAKFGAYGKVCSTAFVIMSITDALEPYAVLSSLTQFATVFHLPTSLDALPLSSSTLIIIVDFFDGHATSP